MMIQRRILVLFVLTCLLATGLVPVQAGSLVNPHLASSNYFWARSMGGMYWEQGNSIAVDSSGNVYTTGRFWGTADFNPGPDTFNMTSAGGNDIFVSKLDSSGNFVWAKSMGGTDESYDGDIGLGIAVDSSGNVYTTGYFDDTADFDPGPGTYNLTADEYDIFVSKLDKNGNFVWAKSMGGSGWDKGAGIAVDSSGNVYTTGYFEYTADFNPGLDVFDLVSPGWNDSIFVSKLDSSGNFVWAKSMVGTNNIYGNRIAVDSSGNVYTTGTFWGTADFDPGNDVVNLTSVGGYDIFVSKLNSSGDYVWAKRMGGTGDDMGVGITIDSSRNVYTTGFFEDTANFDPGTGTFNLISAGDKDTFVSKLNSSGNFVWAKSMGGTGEEIGNGIVLDSSGNVYTTGHFVDTADFDPGAGTYNLYDTSSGYSDIFISKLNNSGNFVWAKSVGGADTDDGLGIAADSSGNIYTTGYFQDTADFYPGPGTYNLTSAGNTDIFVYKPENLGVVPAITGKVYNDSAAAGNEVAGAFIQACLTGGGCQVTTSDSDGSYGFIDLVPGQYQLTAFPPGGNNHLSGSIGPLTLPDNSKLPDENILLLQPTPLPDGTTITPNRSPSADVPMIYWLDPFTLTTTGCSAGTASYKLYQNGAVIRSGSMIESPAGTYTAMVASPYPNHGDANVIITLQCPGGQPTQIPFNIYIDPSGVVVDTNGTPVVDATVTLYRSDVASGPFDILVSGSGVMSAANRINPMQTNTAGLFGWDVIAGYYKVRAEKSGCVAAADHSQAYAQTDVLIIPPPVTDLRLTLFCGEGPIFYINLPLVIR